MIDSIYRDGPHPAMEKHILLLTFYRKASIASIDHMQYLTFHGLMIES